MAENLDIYGFELSDDEMRNIDATSAGDARHTCPAHQPSRNNNVGLHTLDCSAANVAEEPQ